MNKSQIQEKTKKLLEKADRPNEFTKNLQEILKFYVDKEATKNYQRIIPDTGKFYGVPKPVLWVMATETSNFLKEEPAKSELLLKTLWSEGSYEARQIAGKSLEKFGAKNPKICLDFVSSVVPDLDNWSVCDCLAMYGIEPIVYSAPEIVLPLSEKWAKNKNKWIRRFGIVTLRGYKKIKITDKVFAVFNYAMNEDRPDVKKAVSWILRDITKKNPNEVAEFLTKWAKTNPSKDTKWIIKDGMKKLSNNEQKNILRLLMKGGEKYE
ncbi:MAG: DNA alkylation repair protein [Candidatus Cloacimonetes bacterium]|nr:DNA alkylation repair protein [Candidatus Cloacimonadota bacterium]